MSSKSFIPILFVQFLFQGCGVKSPPIYSKESAFPSYESKFLTSDEKLLTGKENEDKVDKLNKKEKE